MGEEHEWFNGSIFIEETMSSERMEKEASTDSSSQIPNHSGALFRPRPKQSHYFLSPIQITEFPSSGRR
jgi:hypothetical protein